MEKNKLNRRKLVPTKMLNKKGIPSKTLYKQKYTEPLKRNHKNEYDAKEEARYNYYDNIESSSN